LYKDNQITFSQIDGVAVSIGPGSFTGLRIGLSTAKGLCYAGGKPLLAVSTFESVAEAVFLSNQETNKVLICIDAKQGDYYVGGYEKKKGIRSEFLPVQIGNLTKALSYFTRETLIITDRTDEVSKILDKSGVIGNFLSYYRGDVLARIALGKLKKGVKSAPEDLEPMYLKDFVIKKQEKAR
jgi:tRNA threonylcarbamoyladenosine biosynthesis protein TsaB